MVCLGNICRSPIAQGIMEKKVEDKGLKWEIDSAGTASYHSGDQADIRSIEIAKKHHIDITKQRARQLIKSDLKDFDLILAMDASNYNGILKLSENESESLKVKMILNYLHPGENRQVPDPYYNGGFQNVYDLLNEACEAVITLES